MRSFVFIIMGIVFCYLPSSGQTADSSGQQELERLKRRMDSLEVRLELASMDSKANAPLATGEYLSWGRGLTFAIELPNPGIEAGYTFRIIKDNIRLGCFAGYTYHYGRKKESYKDYGNQANFAHFKLMAGTPVFFNFMSMSVSIAQLYMLDSPKPAGDAGVDYYTTITKYCAELEFWIARFMCVSVGGIHNRYHYWTENNIGEFDRLNDQYYIDTFKVGVKYYVTGSKAAKKKAKQRD